MTSSHRSAAPSRPIRRAVRALRLAGGLALAGLAVGLFYYQHSVRLGEADLAGRWFGLLLTGGTRTVGDTVYFGWGNGTVGGLRDTWECTVALLAGPLCGIGAVLVAFSRIHVHRLLVGLAAGLAAVIVVNQLRLAMIALGVQHWGNSGYELTHKLVGSLFALAGFAAAVLLLFKIAVTQSGAERC